MDNIFNLFNVEIDFSEIWNKIRQDIVSLMSSLKDLASWFNENDPDNEIIKSLKTIDMLNKAQFVYWEAPSEDFKNEVMRVKDVHDMNLLLEKRFCGEESRMFLELANLCQGHRRMVKYSRVFDQCMRAHEKGFMDIAIIGLCTIIDGLFADISGKAKLEKISENLKEIEKKIDGIEIKEGITLDDLEVPTAIYEMTFFESIRSFIECKDFSGEEPESLNRNWIAHGRLLKCGTELDCQKILRILYGVLLLDDLYEDRKCN